MKDKVIAILNQLEDDIENVSSSSDWVRMVLDMRRELHALVAEVDVLERE